MSSSLHSAAHKAFLSKCHITQLLRHPRACSGGGGGDGGGDGGGCFPLTLQAFYQDSIVSRWPVCLVTNDDRRAWLSDINEQMSCCAAGRVLILEPLGVFTENSPRLSFCLQDAALRARVAQTHLLQIINHFFWTHIHIFQKAFQPQEIRISGDDHVWIWADIYFCASP